MKSTIFIGVRTGALAVALALPAPVWSLDPGVGALDTPQQARWDSVVPQPVNRERDPGVWSLPATVKVDWGGLGAVERANLAQRLDLSLRPLGRSWAGATGRADLTFAAGGPGGEAYEVGIGTGGVTVRASGDSGRYYALITLTQLLPPSARTTEPVEVPTGHIADAPAYPWRGLMLDSSRHFQSVDTIEWVLELMALHKLNRFHWHLTDDQGWRLEVPSWPRLTTVGAWRTEADGRISGGYYSAEDVRRVVAFAASRQIVVVPEVDLPGHSSAALAAYPELSANGLPRDVPLDWGVADGVLSIGRSSVTQFAADVLSTLVDLFPGPYIHWGGDEVYRTPWTRNPESVAWMRSVKASTPDQALAAFWSDLSKRTLAAGRTPIGWDEVAQRGVPAGTIVQWWDDPARAVAALKAGSRLIASWKESSYLDYPELDSDGDRAFWMPVQTLETIAAQPFLPPGAPASAASQLLGLEAGLWTERAPEQRIARKLFPRLALVAELAWRGVPGGVTGWPARIEAHRDRLEAWGVGMPPPVR